MSNEIPSLRDANKNLRRQRIRDAARDIVLEEGPEGLTTRKLARAAGVTAPTLYNLIGPIEDIVTSLIEAGVDRIQSRLDAIGMALSGLQLAEKVVTLSVDVFTEDARAFRAIGLAAEKQALASDANAAGVALIERCVALQHRAVRKAAASGDLRGQLDARLLAEHILICFRHAYRDWCRAELSDEGFRARALHGLFVSLLSDASEKTRDSLITRILKIQTQIADQQDDLQLGASS
jgi:AcrR family transcriptional regulator